MRHTMHKTAWLTITWTLFLAPAVWGQVVPYSASGTGARFFAGSGDYDGTGLGTHLGAHVFTGKVATTATGPLTSSWESIEPQVTTAADGSKLLFDASGEVQLIPLDNLGNFVAIWTGEFEIVGGDGRFANARPGSSALQVTAINDPFNIFTDPVWTFSWTLEGTIDLGRR